MLRHFANNVLAALFRFWQHAGMSTGERFSNGFVHVRVWLVLNAPLWGYHYSVKSLPIRPDGIGDSDGRTTASDGAAEVDPVGREEIGFVLQLVGDVAR